MTTKVSETLFALRATKKTHASVVITVSPEGPDHSGVPGFVADDVESNVSRFFTGQMELEKLEEAATTDGVQVIKDASIQEQVEVREF